LLAAGAAALPVGLGRVALATRLVGLWGAPLATMDCGPRRRCALSRCGIRFRRLPALGRRVMRRCRRRLLRPECSGASACLRAASFPLSWAGRLDGRAFRRRSFLVLPLGARAPGSRGRCLPGYRLRWSFPLRWRSFGALGYRVRSPRLPLTVLRRSPRWVCLTRPVRCVPLRGLPSQLVSSPLPGYLRDPLHPGAPLAGPRVLPPWGWVSGARLPRLGRGRRFSKGQGRVRRSASAMFVSCGRRLAAQLGAGAPAGAACFGVLRRRDAPWAVFPGAARWRLRARLWLPRAGRSSGLLRHLALPFSGCWGRGRPVGRPLVRSARFSVPGFRRGSVSPVPALAVPPVAHAAPCICRPALKGAGRRLSSFWAPVLHGACCLRHGAARGCCALLRPVA